MAHPRMYDDEDPVLARLRSVCALFPGSEEKESWGRPTFRAPKIYAVYGSGTDHPHALLVKAEEDERPALLEDTRFFSPPYYGPGGWVALDLDDPSTDWTEVTELLGSSFRLLAHPRHVAALDAAGLPSVTS